jgi:hypothetical protein
MIKFLSKKGLLSLVPFQAISPEDPEYIWPEPYKGEIERLMGLLRQCPSYQIDKNHSHCGLRSRMLPALDYIRICIDYGIGIKVTRWKTDRATQTWITPKPTSGKGRKPFRVGDELDVPCFDFAKAKPAIELAANTFNADHLAKTLFTAKRWIWTPEQENDNPRLLTPSLKF